MAPYWKNILIIQSLSKTAGLAGLRIGFTFGNKSLIQYINKVTGPYDVNSFAITAALAALKDKSYIDNYVLEVKKAREWILNKFNSEILGSNDSTLIDLFATHNNSIQNNIIKLEGFPLETTAEACIFGKIHL